MVPTSAQLVSRHPVGAGVPCQFVGTDLWIARADWRGARDPESGRDEAWLLTDALTAAWSGVERASEIGGEKEMRAMALADEDLKPLWAEIKKL